MIDCKQIHSYRITVIVIFTLCLMLTASLMAATVNIDLNATNQTIRGFGAATPWYLSAATDSEIESAFGTGDGQIGLTILRLTIEPDSSNWSKWVSSANKAYEMGAEIIASPWHAPTEMRETIGDDYRLRYDMYDEYAAHLNSFVTYMANNDAPIYCVSIQNEPDIGDWTQWTITEILTFVRDNADAIQGTKVMAPESFNFNCSYSDPILNDNTAAANTDIICGHIYGGGLYSYPLAEQKGKEVWMTEYLMGENNSGNNWPWAIALAKNINDVMQAEMNAYVWWTMVRYYGPIGDGTVASDPEDPDESYPAKGEVTKKGYVMSHFSKFVRPGYVRVDATENPSSGVYVTAYIGGSTLVIVTINQNSYSSDVTFSLSGGSVDSYIKYETTSSNNVSNQGLVGSTNTLVASSINTFVGTIGGDDTTPPEPNPAILADAPTAISNTKVTMTATSGSDASGPVEYYFTCTAGGGNDSGWQTSPTYTDSILSPDTQYTYTVKMRDSAPAPNIGAASAPESATTFVGVGQYQESGGVLSMEAENGTLGSRWITGDDGGASNGAYIEIDPAYDNPTGTPECITAECITAYDFNISTSGNYRFWFRMYSDNASDDSFFWRIDSGSWIQENNRSGIGFWFSRDNTQIDGLRTGNHVLEIAYRENGTRLDKFVIQLDSSTEPSGDGPAESSQIFEPSKCEHVQSLGYRLDEDLNGDCQIGMADLILLTDQWLSTSPAAVTPNYSPDLVADNEINLVDFAAIAKQWLICNDPETVDCIKNW